MKHTSALLLSIVTIFAIWNASYVRAAAKEIASGGKKDTPTSPLVKKDGVIEKYVVFHFSKTPKAKECWGLALSVPKSDHKKAEELRKDDSLLSFGKSLCHAMIFCDKCEPLVVDETDEKK